MRIKDVIAIRSNYGVGQIIKVPTMTNGVIAQTESVEIVGKYPHIMIVSNGRYCWAIRWADVELMGITIA